jgi:hypothetical protein
MSSPVTSLRAVNGVPTVVTIPVATESVAGLCTLAANGGTTAGTVVQATDSRVAAFTGDSGTGGAIGLVPAPAAGDAVAGKILGANGGWVNQAQVGRTFYLDPSDSSDLATYKTALTVPSTNVETTLTATLTGTTKSLAAVFATDPNIPAITQLPPGTYTRHFHVATGGVSEVARLYVEIYTCASDGSSETLRRSGYTPEFSGTTVQEVSSSAEDAGGYAMAVTDRLLFKVYWERVSGPANCDITVYFNGSSRAAYVGSTILAALVVGTTAGTVCAGNDSRLGRQPVVKTGTKTANYTALITDDYIPVDATAGGFTITLPLASTVTNPINIVRLDAGVNVITVASNAADTIMGGASISMPQVRAPRNLLPFGSDWSIV